ncbi:MAG: aldo/keto reductase [Clostridia bacterium]|nr:aldo/keto reductase [Clostridia bacterium]
MSYIINGKEVPPIAVGTWSWGSGQNGSGIVFGSKADPTALNESFNIAMESGFTFFDTSAVYGMGSAEKLLAEFSKDRDFVFSDKFTPMGKFSEEKVDQMYNGSVEKFNGRVPDIYWLHQPKHIEKALPYLCKMKKDGKIGSIGVSNFNLEQLKLADKIVKENGCTLSGVQNHFSLLFRTSEENGVLSWCKENNAVFFAYMVLEQGALTGRYNSKNPMPMFSRRGLAFNKRRLKKIEPLIETLEDVGNSHGLSVSETATAYAIAKGIVPIIGVNKPYQAKSLAKIADVELSGKEVERLEKTAANTGVSVRASWE